MPAQTFLIAKVAGAAAEATLRKFHVWSGSRKTRDLSEIGPGQWPRRTRQAMDRFVEGLRANRYTPPVVFCDEYVDLWSSPPIRWPDAPGPLIEVHSDHHQLACYPLPDAGRLQKGMERLKRRRSIHPEDRWFATRTLDAIGAWEGLVGNSVLLFVRTVVGPLVEDHEIEESLNRVPAWIR